MRLWPAGISADAKGGKGAILDEFVATSGYSRWQASYLLRWWERKVWAGDKKVLVAGATRKKQDVRVRCHDQRVVAVPVKTWKIMDYICGKRLAPVLGDMTDLLERLGEIKCDRETRQFRSVEIVIDELPFGLFMEIEGSITAIREAEIL